MAQLHSVETKTSQPVMWTRLNQFINVCNPECDNRLVTEFLSKQQLLDEANYLEQLLSESDCPIVFCHNDALLGNIVLRRDEGNLAVTFIDLEYGAANYGAFDIANHFCEFVSCE